MSMSMDYGYHIELLRKENEDLRMRIASLEKRFEEGDKDWDNATLLRNWGISKRTAKNYRDKGLGYYRLHGNGPIFYTMEDRETFKTLYNKESQVRKNTNSN